ncbi:septum formation family protein [Parafrankia elaeagni]|uniref:septum formation family protein n=1 Tax=Parafrankia elaeagni TaxID=222534 RepID=UPI0003600C07|nr:septum formation family protein [Parafrankia elaeagni]
MPDDSAPADEADGRPRQDGGATAARAVGEPDPLADPFAGLVLDEAFVSAATRYEAPARTRQAVARFAPLEDERAWRGSGPRRGRRGAARRAARTAAAASRRAVPPGPAARDLGSPAHSRGYLILAIVCLLLLAGLLYGFGRPMADDPPRTTITTGSSAPPGGSPAAAGDGDLGPDLSLPQAQWRAGRCYSWIQSAPASPVDDVPCAGQHLFEAVGPLDISPAFPDNHHFPSRAEWEAIAHTHCGPVITAYLGYPLDPFGRFVDDIIRPSRAGWDGGDRIIVCGLAAAGTTADDDGWSPPFEGTVRGADQAHAHPPGTCFRGGDGSSTVAPCDSPHHAQSVGSARLPDTADGQPPSSTVFSELAAAACAASTAPYLGPGPAGAVFQESWHLIRPESWRAGTRTTTCTVRLVDANGQLQEMSGLLAPAGEREAAGVAV